MGRTPNKPTNDYSSAGTAPSGWRPDIAARRAKKKANDLEALAARLRSVVLKDGGIATLSSRELLGFLEELIYVEQSYLEASEDPRAITIRKPAFQIIFNYHPEGYDPLDPKNKAANKRPDPAPTPGKLANKIGKSHLN